MTVPALRLPADEPAPLSPDEIGAFARALHGQEHGAIRALADRLGIQYDTLRKAAAGSRRLGPFHTQRLRELMAAAALTPVLAEVEIARPPAVLSPEADRDGPCGEALDPALDALAGAAEEAGWHPAEVAAAVLSWTVHRVAEQAGEAAARQLLDEADEILALRRPGPAAQ